MASDADFQRLVADYDELARGALEASPPQGLDIWSIATIVIGAGIVACATWLLGVAAKQRELEAWRRNVNEEMRELKAESKLTHDAVTVLQEGVRHLTDDVCEIKDDQKSILRSIAELISRP